MRPVSCFGYKITQKIIPKRIRLRLGISFCLEPRFYVVFPPTPCHAINDTNTNEYLPCMKIFVYVELTILQYDTFYKRKKKANQ